jgi:hypothetical protein
MTSPPLARRSTLPLGPRRGFEWTAPLVALRRSKSLRQRAPRSAAGPPTRAIAGARARALTMATVRPPKHLNSRGYCSHRWKNSLGLRGAPRTRRACFSFRYRCHAALPRVLLAPFPILRASSPSPLVTLPRCLSQARSRGYHQGIQPSLPGRARAQRACTRGRADTPRQLARAAG